jgi:hypothetical protein
MLNMITLASLIITPIVFGLASARFGEDSRRDERNW